MKFSTGRDVVITISGLGLMVAAFIFFVYLPGKHACDEYRRQIDAADKQIRQIPLKVAELEVLRDEVEERREELGKTVTLMPNEADLHNVIREVANLAKMSDLEVTRLEPLTPIDHETYQIMPFQLNMSGKFYGMAAFLRGLESRERLFTIKELSLTSDDRRNPGIVAGDVYFSVYVRRTDSSDSNENDAS